MFNTVRPICSLSPLLFVVLCILGPALPARAETYQIEAVARPARIVIGGDNKVTIDVTVKTMLGEPAPNNTPVYFNTTLGMLPTVAYTQQGKVSVLMENETSVGIARITVTVGDSREVIDVEYLGKDGVSSGSGKPRRMIYHLKAKQVYYSMDQRLFDLRDNAEFVAPDFTVTAGAIQYDLDQNVLCAQGTIVITANKKQLGAVKLRMSPGTPTGSIVTSDPDIRFQTFTLPQLEAVDDEAVQDVDFHQLDPLPTKTWILCSQATVVPHEQIQFRRPQFYLDSFDHKLYSLPYHVLDLRYGSGGTFFNSQISLTSDAGLSVDFPVYYDASDSHVGSLHFRQVARGSSNYSGTSGFQMGLEQEYLLGDYADGGFYVDDITRDTRSFTWEHNHDIGNLYLDMRASYERYSVETPYTTRLGLSASRNFGQTRTRLTTDWSEFEGNQNGLAELSVQLPSLALGKTGLSMNFDPYIGLTRNVYPATEELPKEESSNFYQGMRTGVSFPTLKLVGGTLTTSLSDEVAHDQDGTITNYLDSSITYRRPIARTFTTSLSYSYGLSNTNKDETSTEPTQRVSFDINGNSGSSWNLYGYSNYSFNTEQFYHSVNATYYLPWFRQQSNIPRCYLRYRTSITHGKEIATVADQLFTLGWNFGNYALVAHYSPTGNNAVTGLGTGSGKRWAIELVRSGW